MTDSTLILLLGIGLGMLHALDADHIMAVSGLASSRADLKGSTRFCLQWATGHGVILLLVATAVYIFNMAIPDQLSGMAENMAGIVLIIIGLLVLFELYKRKIYLSMHHHQGLPVHIHWDVSHVEAGKHGMPRTYHDHRAVLVGMLHGLAGSAPLFAIIPVTQSDNAWVALCYVLLFCIGVVVSMLVFGGFIGMLFRQLLSYSHNLVQSLRVLVGVSAILFGIVLLQGAAGY